MKASDVMGRLQEIALAADDRERARLAQELHVEVLVAIRDMNCEHPHVLAALALKAPPLPTVEPTP